MSKKHNNLYNTSTPNSRKTTAIYTPETAPIKYVDTDFSKAGSIEIEPSTEEATSIINKPEDNIEASSSATKFVTPYKMYSETFLSNKAKVRFAGTCPMPKGITLMSIKEIAKMVLSNVAGTYSVITDDQLVNNIVDVIEHAPDSTFDGIIVSDETRSTCVKRFVLDNKKYNL